MFSPERWVGVTSTIRIQGALAVRPMTALAIVGKNKPPTGRIGRTIQYLRDLNSHASRHYSFWYVLAYPGYVRNHCSHLRADAVKRLPIQTALHTVVHTKYIRFDFATAGAVFWIVVLYAR